MADSLITCDLADIRFHFHNLPSDPFNRFFRPFVGCTSCAAEQCHVFSLGPQRELCGLRSDQAWSFSWCDGAATLTGANPQGEVLWRIRGSPPYERLTFEWHPTAYAALYHNEAYGDYGIVAILALVLRLLHAGGFVMHGSAQLLDGAAVLCTGPSGRGKSTISRLFAARGLTVLTDERPVLRRERCADGFRVYGSPWPSSGGFALNASAPLRKIYFLEHGSEHAIEPLTRREAVLRLLDVSLVPWLDAAFFDPVIATLEALLSAVPAAVLRFRPEPSVVDVVRGDACA